MADLEKMKKEDLLSELAAKHKGLYDFSFSFAGSSRRNVKEARELRKDVARIETELKRRELSSEE